MKTLVKSVVVLTFLVSTVQGLCSMRFPTRNAYATGIQRYEFQDFVDASEFVENIEEQGGNKNIFISKNRNDHTWSVVISIPGAYANQFNDYYRSQEGYPSERGAEKTPWGPRGVPDLHYYEHPYSGDEGTRSGQQGRDDLENGGDTLDDQRGFKFPRGRGRGGIPPITHPFGI